MTLQLLICTFDSGINQVASLVLPPAKGITYLVSWQHSSPAGDRTVPDILQRSDITVAHLEGQGLSRNRNNCLKHATGDICLICDDDCKYTHERLKAIIDVFEHDTETDLATFMMQSEFSNKAYPSQKHDLAVPFKNYYPTSFEIAFRRSQVIGRLRFNENFGLRSPIFQCAEEEIFVHDALALGLRCHFYPITVVEHDHPTTETTRAALPGVLMAYGAFLYIAYRPTMLLRAPLVAWRLSRRQGVRLGRGLYYIHKGMLHIALHPQLATAGRIDSSSSRTR